MVSYWCPTCDQRDGHHKMTTHLLETHHYSVVRWKQDEIVKCQFCDYTGVHDLTLLQVGTSDYILSCEVCMPEEVPNWEQCYRMTLKNRELLTVLPDYYQLADRSCAFCDSKDGLMIARTGSNNFTVCQNCCSNKGLRVSDYLIRGVDSGFLLRVNPVSGTQLSAFKKRAAAVRKQKIPKGKKTSRTPSPPIIPQPVLAPNVSQQNGVRTPDGVKDDQDSSLELSTTSRNSGTVTGADLFRSYQKNYGVPSLESGCDATDSLASELDGLSLEEPPTISHIPVPVKDRKIRTKSSSAPKEPVSFHNFVPLSKTGMAKLRAVHDLEILQRREELSEQQESRSRPSLPDPDITYTSTSLLSPSEADLPKLASLTSDIRDHLPLEEFEHIPVISPRPSRLSYSSLFDYYKEVSDHLFFEQRITSGIISPINVTYNARERDTFKFDVPYTTQIDDMVKKNLRDIDFIPFYRGQSLFVGRGADLENVYHCFVSDVRLIKEWDTKTHIEIICELYFWNDSTTSLLGYTDLWFMPASPIVSRVMTAMLRMDNPLFQKLLLGQEKIRHGLLMEDPELWNLQLNDSQTMAVQHSLSNDVTIIKGPPGTGKTTVIFQIIQQMLKLKKFPILVVAASNFAVDNIAEKFMGTPEESKIVRMLSREKESSYGTNHKLAAVCLHHQIIPKLSPLAKSMHQELSRGRAFNLTRKDYFDYQARLRKAKRGVIQNKCVIFTTTVASGMPELGYGVDAIPVVIMDESTQSSEATSLIPLSIPKVEKFVFVGDEKQLSSHSEIEFLEQSLFERILKNGTYDYPNMLTTQYRMHPAISEFPNKRFYDGQLRDGVTAEQRGIGLRPLLFFDCNSRQDEKVNTIERGPAGLSQSYVNHGEVNVIVLLLSDLISQKIIKGESIGVITPYAGQRDALANAIRDNKKLNPAGLLIKEDVEDSASIAIARPSTIKTIADITVASIDAFQGREKDLVIMSCVRSNQEGKIGFVKDVRRLNVALTRARSSLLIVGNQKCLRSNKTWRSLLNDLQKNNRIVAES